MTTVRLFSDLTLKERDDGLRGSVSVAVVLRSVQCFLHGLFNFFYLTICSLTHGNLVSARLQDSR